MKVKRNELMDLLRSREAAETAQRAETSLPLDIDLDRDSALLRQCGIDPNVLAVLIATESRPGQPPEPSDESQVAGDLALVDQLSASDSSSIAAPAGSTGPMDASLPAVVHPPASWCPRCQMRFTSVDTMLDHLSSEHLSADVRRKPSATPDRARLGLSTRDIDEALTDLARAFQEPAFERPPSQHGAPQRRPRLALMTVFGPLLLVTGIIAILAGTTLAGVVLIVPAIFVIAIASLVRRHRSVETRTPQQPEDLSDCP